MRVHLVRADELHPGDIVVGTDQVGPYPDGTRKKILLTERAEGDDGPLVRLVCVSGPPVEYHPGTTLLVNPNR